MVIAGTLLVTELPMMEDSMGPGTRDPEWQRDRACSRELRRRFLLVLLMAVRLFKLDPPLERKLLLASSTSLCDLGLESPESDIVGEPFRSMRAKGDTRPPKIGDGVKLSREPAGDVSSSSSSWSSASSW